MAWKGYGSKLVSTTVDAKDLRRAMSKLPKEVQNEIRDSNKQNASELARAIQHGIGAGDPPQASLVSPSVRPVRDRNVRVDVGGERKAGRPYKSSKAQGRKYRAPAGALMYGAEYGGSGKSQDRAGRNMGNRFVRPHNANGYFINPAFKKYAPKLLADWAALIDREITKRGLK